MHLQLVVKVSKLCNLRCTYCYETQWLADRAHLTTANIETLFWNVRDLFALLTQREQRVTFYWQGGEPFLLPSSYWYEVLARQRKVFGGTAVRVANEIQSNGLRIKAEHLPLLRNDFLLGLSFDVANDARVTIRGADTTDLFLSQLDLLERERIPISGCIIVVSKHNVDCVDHIVAFIRERRLSVRLLNIYTAIDQLPQVAELAVPWADYLDLCLSVAKAGLTQHGLRIEPISTALDMRDAHRTGASTGRVGPEREWVLVIDTNGDVYSAGDLYDPAYRYGNVLTDHIATLFSSPGRTLRVQRSKTKLDRICRRCPLYGQGCDGSFAAHCTPEELREFEELGTCYFGWLALNLPTEPLTLSSAGDATG